VYCVLCPPIAAGRLGAFFSGSAPLSLAVVWVTRAVQRRPLSLLYVSATKRIAVISSHYFCVTFLYAHSSHVCLSHLPYAACAYVMCLLKNLLTYLSLLQWHVSYIHLQYSHSQPVHSQIFILPTPSQHLPHTHHANRPSSIHIWPIHINSFIFFLSHSYNFVYYLPLFIFLHMPISHIIYVYKYLTGVSIVER